MIDWLRFAVATDGFIVPVACVLFLMGLITLIAEFARGRIGIIGAVLLSAGLLLMPSRQWPFLGARIRNAFHSISIPGITPKDSPGEKTDAYEYRDGKFGVNIVKYRGEEESVLLPVLLGGKVVSSMEMGAFSGCRTLRKVTIGSQFPSIPAAAFAGCLSLREVVIREGPRSIGAQAFAMCPQLAEISIPASIQGIADSAFPGDCRAVFTIVPGSEAEKFCAARGYQTKPFEE